MKKLSVILVVLVMVGCASTRNTVNRLQGDVKYFQGELARYSLFLSEENQTDAIKVLKDAEDLLADAERATRVGDKLAEKKYLSALVDIMDLLAKYED